MPRLVTLADEYRGKFLLVMVNVDDSGSLARRYAVNSVPTVKVFRDGVVVDTVHGAEPDASFRAILDRFIAGAGEEVRAAAQAAFTAGDYPKACELIAQAALDAPDDAAVAEDLMRILLGSGKAREALGLFRNMPPAVRAVPEVSIPAGHAQFIVTALDAPGPEAMENESAANPADDMLRFRLASVRLVNDDVEGALDALMDIVRRNPGFEEGMAHRGLLAIFALLGPEHELTRHFRSQLAQALGH